MFAKKKQLNFGSKTSKKVEIKCHKNTNDIQLSISNMSDEEYYNFSDSSLELFDTFQPRTKKQNLNKSDLKLNSNVNFDQIDLTNAPYFESESINTEISSSIITINSSSSNHSINCSSSESFKSTKSSLSSSVYNYSNKHSLDCSLARKRDTKSLKLEGANIASNKYSTPKHSHSKAIDLTESAKLLDRIYGKKWRSVDGVIKNCNKTNLNNVFDCNYKWCNENKDINDIDYCKQLISSHCTKPTSSKYVHQQDLQTAVNDTSVILENFSLSNDVNEIKFKTSTQPNKNESKDTILHNVKQISELKTSKKDNINNSSHSNQHRKVQLQSNSEAKLSFLSSLSCFTGSMKCDPEAEKYKTKFKKNKDNLVSVLFKLFNEEVFDNKLPVDMNFKWNARLRSTAGACFNKRTVKINVNLECERVSRIELSSKIIDTAERLRDTLVHELCHAACWIFNGVSEGHGPYWKSWANKAMQKFPELPVIKRCHSYDIQTKYTYKCLKCGYSFGRHSKSLNLEKKRCGFCYGEFELIVNKINKNPSTDNNFPKVYTDPLNELYNLNEGQQKPKIPKKPSKFALFVKENYNQIKRENPRSKHGDIMKLLGSKFATTKILTPDEVFDKLLDS